MIPPATSRPRHAPRFLSAPLLAILVVACSSESGPSGTPFSLCVDNTCTSIDSSWDYFYNNSGVGSGSAGSSGPNQDATGISTVSVSVRGRNTGFVQAYSPISIVQFQSNHYTGGCNLLTAENPSLGAIVIPVGPGKPHTTIQSAIDHAPGTDTVIRLEDGVHAPFEVRGYPGLERTLVIASEGAAQVDSTLGPIRLSSLEEGDVVVLDRLTIGSRDGSSSGLEVSDVRAGSLLLSNVQVMSRQGSASVLVTESTRLALQSVRADSLRVEGGSEVRACSGSLGQVELGSQSQLTVADMTTDGVRVEPGALLLESDVATPVLQVPSSFELQGPTELLIQAAPHSSWSLYGGRRLEWAAAGRGAGPVAELVAADQVLLASGLTDSNGRAVLPVSELPGWTIGHHRVLQAVVSEPTASESCATNLQVTVPMPPQ